MKHKISLAALLVTLVVSLSGCFTTHLYNGPAAGGAPSPMVYEKWHHNGIWGLVDFSGPYWLDQVCPNGWSRIDLNKSFVNGLAQNLLTGGTFGVSLWTPPTTTLWCGATVQNGHVYKAVAIAPDGSRVVKDVVLSATTR